MTDYFESGFSVREPMWHGKGYVPDRYPADIAEAREWAGLQWEPEKEPLFTMGGDETDHYPGWREVPGWQAVLRSDTRQIITTVRNSYELISNQEMFEIVELLLDQPGVRYETAGSVKDGAKVWALARIDEPFQVGSDESPTYPYLTVLNSHDGSAACKVMATTIRVVCWNTWNAADAEGERSGRQFAFRHTRNVRDRIEEARDAIAGVRDEAVRWRAMAEELLGLRVTSERMERFVVDFIPMPPEGIVSDRVVRNVDEARAAVRAILNGKTVDGAGIGGTAYGLVQAAGEYLDHVRGYRNRDTYLGRTLLRPQSLKARAVDLAREAASA